MKNNLNVIQIRGLRGLIFAVMIGCCLVAGFVVFPGWLCMQIWNALEKSFAPWPLDRAHRCAKFFAVR